MANNPVRLIQQFAAFSGAGLRQTSWDVPMDDADLDTRDKCEITVEDVVQRRTILDCEGRDPDSRVVDTRLKRFTFVYAGLTPQILARWAGYFFGTAAAPTGTPADEVQTITRTGTVSGGTFTLTFTLEGRTGTTRPIAWNATAAVIQAAMVKVGASIGNLLKAGDVVVSGDWTGGMVVTFGGRLAKADIPLLTADVTALTGTTPGLAIAETDAGAQNYHAFTRSTSDTKVKFSFALGFKTNSALTEKYYNAVCERFDPVLNRGGDVSLTVSVLANYEPEEVSGFSLPACVNYTPLKTSECRVEIDSNWETLDIFSETYTLNDNVPVDADTFGFDSTDPEAMERGDNPAYAIQAQIFGVKTDPIGVAVKNEAEVEYVTHFGFPGNRFSLIAPRTSLIPQTNSRQFAGARNRSVVALDGLPLRDTANPPVRAEFYGNQSTAFLQT